ncbi:hypothetical protein U9M48_009748 [Paspalum notatum var. saurae]|uniref:Uncharacterized protein n=1 Tax=Paspalum notatum var. saurae TaxID=547442 RepID=A0AAQ3STB9_PASNO
MAAILSADGVADEAKEAVVASLIAVQVRSCLPRASMVRAEGIPLLIAPLLSQLRSSWMHEDEKRLGGYQKILMYGLGSAFFGAACGVLDKLDTKSIFHIISKAALWIVLVVLWFIVIVLKIVINFFALLKSALGSLSSNQENSLKTGLIRRNHGNRTGDRKSSNV